MALSLQRILLAILALCLLLRIIGTGYGLPLTVVTDETPFTYAALQMMQSKTLIPALHPELFTDILPYPPYISYALLVPFALIAGLKYFLFAGDPSLFSASMLTDLSAFFMTARFLNVALGTLSVFLVYRIAQRLLRSELAALWSAALLSTSLLHIALSMVGRNWMPTSFIFLCALYALTSDKSLRWRYTVALAFAGVGIGISSLCALALPMIAIYYIFYDFSGLRSLSRDFVRLLPSGVLFVVLALIPFGLYRHGGSVFAAAVTFFADKSVLGLLLSPLNAVSLIAYSEPIFVGLLAAGLIVTFRAHRKFGLFVLCWIFFYAATFYMMFRLEPRFMLPLVPVFALCAGYALSRVHVKSVVVALVFFSLTLVPAGRLSYLSVIGDTREVAREWILQLGPQDKVLVFAAALRVPTTRAAVEEMRAADSSALRKVDEADAALDRTSVPHTFNNLTSVTDQEFIEKLPEYARASGYDYLVVEPRSLAQLPRHASSIERIVQDAELVRSIQGFGDDMSLYNSAFTLPILVLFEGKMLGPELLIYRL